jgi:hypothetical protein
MPHRPLSPVVLAFLRKVGEAINSIAVHTQYVVDVAKPVPGSDSSAPVASGMGGVEALR